MKNVSVKKEAAVIIDNLRNGDGFELTKAGIANSLSSLAKLIDAGRDNEDINVWTDDLLSVMYVLGEYNDLVNALYFEKDNSFGHYCYEDPNCV